VTSDPEAAVQRAFALLELQRPQEALEHLTRAVALDPEVPQLHCLIALAKLQLDAIQLPLFDAGERRSVAVDRVRERFGYHSVHLATTLGRHARRSRDG
jgi:hypothetical protein